jgi:hypothetical protein
MEPVKPINHALVAASRGAARGPHIEASDRVSTFSDSNLQTTRPADPRLQMFEIDRTCSNNRHEKQPPETGGGNDVSVMTLSRRN